MTDQRCGTCRHYENKTHPYQPVEWGDCNWKDTTPTAPWWVFSRHAVYPTEGTDCPTWEATDE